LEVLIACVHRTALRKLDIRFPEAVASDRPIVAEIKDRQRFVTFLRELQQKERAVILAEPVVVTASGRPASLASHSGKAARSRSVSWLNVLPEVQPGGQIRVVLEVTRQTAGKRTLDAESFAIKVRDGQTLALTGLIMKQIRATSEKVPVLGDLPLVGSLFSRTSYQEEEEEVLVLVTPRLLGDL
jgi:type IV pilus assembly protein PilQ